MNKMAIVSFRKYGVVILRGVFKGWVEILRKGVAKNMQTPGPHVRVYKGDNPADVFYYIFNIR